MSDLRKVMVVEIGGQGARYYLVQGVSIELLSTLPIADLNIGSIASMARECAQNCDPAVVVGSSSGFWNKRGVVEVSPNVGLPVGTNLAAVLRESTGRPGFVWNDVKTATAGATIIFDDHPDSYICTNIGSGVGQGVLEEGRLVSVYDERGHEDLDSSPFALPCSCTKIGCVESVIGGRAMTRRVRFAADAFSLEIPENTSPLAFLDQEYLAGKQWAQTMYGQFALGVGSYLANMLLGNKVPLIVFRGTTVRKAFAIDAVRLMTYRAMMSRLPQTGFENIEFRMVPERPDLPKDYDSCYGAAYLGLRELDATA